MYMSVRACVRLGEMYTGFGASKACCSFRMGGGFGSPDGKRRKTDVPTHADYVVVSWGRIRLPPVIWRTKYSASELEERFEPWESLEYHILWQPTVSKGVRYVIDVDLWPKKGSRVFSG